MKNLIQKIFLLFILGFIIRFINSYMDMDYIVYFSIFLLTDDGFIISLNEIIKHISHNNVTSTNTNSKINLNNKKSNVDYIKLLKESAKQKDLSFFQKCRCKIYWILIEKDINKKNIASFQKTYKEFKSEWDPKRNIIENYSNEEKHKWSLRLKVIKWILNRRNSN